MGFREAQNPGIGGLDELTTTEEALIEALVSAGITTVLDEDNLASNSDTALATQQSIKAYVDSVGSGATTALGNLASVAINTSLISDTDSTDDLGSASIAWANLYVDTIRSGTGVPLAITPASGYNLNISLATTGDFAVNTSQLYVDTSSGNVGIGTAGPDGRLHVHNGSAGSVTAQSSGDDFVVENSGAGGISILTPDANNASILFGSPSDNIGANIIWNHDGNLLTFGTANADADITFQTGSSVNAMRILYSGNVGIGITSPTAYLHLKAGTATASTAPIKLTAGTVNTTPESGTIEFDGTDLFITI